MSKKRSAYMQQYGTSYKRGTLFLPKALREKVYIVYAFVRVVDQIVDTPGVDKVFAKKQLDAMYAKTCDAWQGIDIEDNLVSEFVVLSKQYNFAREWIDGFFQAMYRDIDSNCYDTYIQLQTYMYGSAEVIGLMMTQLIGYTGDKEQVFGYAKKLGEAMQYTNFLRDVREDWVDHGRVYMPLDRLQPYGLTHDDVITFAEQQRGDDRWYAFCRQEVAYTRDLYQHAFLGIKSLDTQGRFAVGVASSLYRGILSKIEKIRYDQFARDAHTTKREKFRLFLGAWKMF